MWPGGSTGRRVRPLLRRFESEMRSAGKSLAHLRSKPLPWTGVPGDDVARERPLEAVQSPAENTFLI